MFNKEVHMQRQQIKHIVMLLMSLIIMLGMLDRLHSMTANNSNLELYEFDADHTTITWHVDHFGFSDLTGKCLASGKLWFDEAHPENSKVEIVIDTRHMKTAVEQLDDTLKGAAFFNSDNYPTAKFESTHVKVTGANTGVVTGTLTIDKITKTLSLNVKLNKKGIHPYYHKPALGFTATTSLKRSDFDMTGYLPDVGDLVKIDIQAEAIKSSN